MSSATASGTIEPAECMRLLGSVPVGRVVFTENALPAVRPVNFVVHDGSVVLRTAGDARLLSAIDGSIIAFQADDIEPRTRVGWSVTAVGGAMVVTADDELAELAALGIEPWAPGERSTFVRIAPEQFSGRWIGDQSTS